MAMLRAAVMYRTKVGRVPRRKDFRDPQRTEWARALDYELPTSNQVELRFGTWNQYLEHAGMTSAGSALDLASIERAGIEHVSEVYGSFAEVPTEANSYDGLVTIDDAEQRVEVKASLLARRANKDRYFFNFKTHSRTLSKMCDRVIFVGLGWDDEAQDFVPLCRYEFTGPELPLVDDKSTVMLYASTIWAAGSSQYRRYLKWRSPDVSMNNLGTFLHAESKN